VFLLDDPLSAVDAHVGKDLFFECIHNTLRTQRNKGVILVTHQLQNMRYADKILVLSPSGQQVFYGSHEELLPRRAEFPYIEVDGGAGSEEGTEEGGGIAKRRCESDASVASSVVVEEVNPEESPTFAESPSPSSSPSAQSVAIAKANDNANGNAKAKGFIISTEDRAVGSVTSDTYTQYLKSGGLLLGSTALLYAVVGQMLSMLADYWLRWWASETYGSQDHPLYQWIFALLVFLTILVGYHKVELWFYFTNIASKELHLQSLWGVLHSPLSFFVANPTGRILNRFTKDQNQVDELFPSTFFDCFQCVLFCLSSLALVCISIPWLLLGMIPVSYLFLHYRNRYIQSSLEVKRIEAVTRSPIYADFSATLDGLSTLRAFQLQDRLVISFHRALDGNARAWFSFLMTSRWLGYRLDLISSFILIALLFVSVALKGRVDVGLIGFALVYTLSLAGLLQWTVRQSAEVENQMTSVERIRSYGSLPPEVGYHAKVEELDPMQLLTVSPSGAPLPKEKGYSNGSNYQHLSDDLENPPLPLSQQRNPLLSLPSSLSPSALVPGVRVGHVEIRSLEVTYRPDLPPVLRGLTMDIPPGCKVGICGRTGSGKSSLLQALLRLNIVTAGDVLVDGVSLLSLSLEESRGLISLIPQDPHLFSGTVRFNIDPFHQFSDEEIWNALRDAQLSDHLQAQAQAVALASEGQQRAEGEDRSCL
jgi:ATP-binding cassette, subfamily C (CFTR/MRP), member 4